MCGPQFIAPQIADAIREGVLAGIYAKAARLNPDSADVWARIGAAHHARASVLLGQALADAQRPDRGPCYFGDDQ